MRHATRRGLAGTVALVAALALTNCAHADVDLIFDNYIPNDPNLSGEEKPPRDANEGLGSRIQINGTEDITIGQIGVLNTLTLAGEMRFLIFEHDPIFGNHTLAYQSNSVSFGTGESWKLSPEFIFVLEAGKQYDIGAVSSVNANWNIDNTPHTENSIASITGLPNFRDADFGGPGDPVVLSHGGSGDGALRLYAIPEPSTILLWLGMGVVGLVIHRRRK